MNNKVRQITVMETYQWDGSLVIYLNSVRRNGNTTNVCRSYITIVALEIRAHWMLSHSGGRIPSMQQEGPFLSL